jgi:hypothetical protein
VLPNQHVHAEPSKEDYGATLESLKAMSDDDCRAAIAGPTAKVRSTLAGSSPWTASEEARRLDRADRFGIEVGLGA